MTKYVVLVKTGEANTHAAGGTGQGLPGWRNAGTTEAASADAACQQIALEQYAKTPFTGAREYVAVPERSFQPARVHIDANPKASISARVSA